MHFTDYHSATDNFTDTWSSDIPRPHHSLEYIICSTFMYFVSSDIDLDFSTSFSLSRPP